jgi:hypothetical protein
MVASMDAIIDVPGREHWTEQIREVDLEILREAELCGIPLDQPSLFERVLRNDETICRQPNAAAFQRLRAFVTMHLSLRRRAIDAIGREATVSIITGVWNDLMSRIGPQGTWLARTSTLGAWPQTVAAQPLSPAPNGA